MLVMIVRGQREINFLLFAGRRRGHTALATMSPFPPLDPLAIG